MMPQPVYHVSIQDVNKLHQQFLDTWAERQQSIIDDAIDQWQKGILQGDVFLKFSEHRHNHLHQISLGFCVQRQLKLVYFWLSYSRSNRLAFFGPQAYQWSKKCQPVTQSTMVMLYKKIWHHHSLTKWFILDNHSTVFRNFNIMERFHDPDFCWSGMFASYIWIYWSSSEFTIQLYDLLLILMECTCIIFAHFDITNCVVHFSFFNVVLT